MGRTKNTVLSKGQEPAYETYVETETLNDMVPIWHKPKSEAPYVCIEPWSALPSRDGIVEELSCQSDLTGLDAGENYEITWTIEIGQ